MSKLKNNILKNNNILEKPNFLTHNARLAFNCLQQTFTKVLTF